MRGSLRKRYEGSWSLIFDVGKDTTGKRKQRTVTFRGNKHEAESKLRELVGQQENGTLPKPNKLTCAAYLEHWLKDYAQSRMAPRSFDRYCGVVRQYLIPDFGAILLTQLRREHLQAHYTRLHNIGMSAGTIHYHHHVIHSALETAIEWELLNRNVAHGITLPTNHVPEMQTWDEDEVRRFLEAAKSIPQYALFFTTLFTGMRKSEIMGLQWKDVDLLGLQISVRRSAQYDAGGKVVVGDVKNDSSRRSISITPALSLALKELWERRKVGQDHYVFEREDGRPAHPNTITAAWNATIGKARVKPIRFHDARHTHATLLLMAGVHPKVVQERLGHASIAMTLDLYTHVVPGMQEAAALKFDTLIWRKAGP